MIFKPDIFKEMNKISSTIARTPAIIIDVREKGEYKESHHKGAINLPSTAFNPKEYEPFRFQPISLVCNTGIRAIQVKEKLESVGFTNVTIHPEQMQHVREKINVGIEGSWTIDRQFRLFMGIMMAVCLLGQTFLSANFALINIIICIGLTFTAIIDRCYLKMGIARLPWNRNS